jgi:hypothetical protein
MSFGKLVGTSVRGLHRTDVSKHVQFSGQMSVPLLCQSTDDTVNAQIISLVISLKKLQYSALNKKLQLAIYFSA